MGVKERAADVGRRRARQCAMALGEELHRARLEHGLSQAAVGAAAGISRSQVSRVEKGAVPRLSIELASRLCSVLGLELSARAYPGGSPIRDAAHRALIERLRARVAPIVAWRFEVPLPGAGDRRAWDTVLLIGMEQVAVEAETRPRDVQAMQRRVAMKLRDDPGVASVVLLLADTRHNRRLLREHGDALQADYPVPAATILSALAEGRSPGGGGIVLL